MKPVISIENLSKSYIIRHQGRQRYTALRDILAQTALNLPKKIIGTFKAKQNEKAESDEKKKEKFWALKDISLEINAGERIGIIGRNGAGKSTLLKVLSRITHPSKGRMTIRGRVASLLEVGTGFHPELTGRENIFLNGAILGMHRSEIKKKFDEIVAFSEVEKFLDTPVKRYSSGMYVRLAFAVAAHLETEILLVDEVLAVGDAQFQKKCLGKMSDVANNMGRTVLFVSHNMGAVAQLCSRGILLDKGCNRYDGTIAQVIEQYYDSMEEKGKTQEWEREGTGVVRLLSIKLLDTNGKPISVLEMGCASALQMEVVCNADKAEYSICFQIADTLGKSVIYSYNQYNTYIAKKGEVSVYMVEMPPVSLMPGSYFLHVFLGKSGIECYDYPKNVCRIEVAQSIAVPVTLPLSQKYGYVFQEFTIKEIR